jgi:hypothetical protein
MKNNSSVLFSFSLGGRRHPVKGERVYDRMSSDNCGRPKVLTVLDVLSSGLLITDSPHLEGKRSPVDVVCVELPTIEDYRKARIADDMNSHDDIVFKSEYYAKKSEQRLFEQLGITADDVMVSL